MHSYWDDFFGLRGLKDAVVLATLLGKEAEARYLREDPGRVRRGPPRVDPSRGGAPRNRLPARLRRARRLRRDVHDGRARTRRRAGAAAEAALERTFAKYLENVAKREAGEGEIYTPYEWRTVGALVRLGRRDDVLPLLDALLPRPAPRRSGTSGARWSGATRGRRSSSATSRTPGSAPTSSAPSSTCSRTSGRRTRRSSWPRAPRGVGPLRARRLREAPRHAMGPPRSRRSRPKERGSASDSPG